MCAFLYYNHKFFLTCGAAGILWACSEGEGTGPLSYSYPRPTEGYEKHKTINTLHSELRCILIHQHVSVTLAVRRNQEVSIPSAERQCSEGEYVP